MVKKYQNTRVTRYFCCRIYKSFSREKKKKKKLVIKQRIIKYMKEVLLGLTAFFLGIFTVFMGIAATMGQANGLTWWVTLLLIFSILFLVVALYFMVKAIKYAQKEEDEKQAVKR